MKLVAAGFQAPVTIVTETNGGFKDLSISHCVITPSKAKKVIHLYREGLSGISFQIVDGGTMDGVRVRDVRIQGTRAPLFLRLGDRARPFRGDMPRPGVGVLCNVLLSDIIATEAGSMGSPIAGSAGHPIENVTLKNIQLSTSGGGKKEEVLRRFEEKRGSYPRSDMFAERLPASGLYFWHVKNISLESVRLFTTEPDERPQIVFENASAVKINGKVVEDQSKHLHDAVRFVPG